MIIFQSHIIDVSSMVGNSTLFPVILEELFSTRLVVVQVVFDYSLNTEKLCLDCIYCFLFNN